MIENPFGTDPDFLACETNAGMEIDYKSSIVFKKFFNWL